MRRLAAAALALLAGAAAAQTRAADFDAERLATCRDSWLAWSKSDPERFERAAAAFQAAYARDDAQGVHVPKARATLFGFPIVGIQPETVGMMVGFSVQVRGRFDAVRPAVEKAIGKGACKTQREGGESFCEIKVREEEGTALVASASPTETLVACAYKYEK